MTSFVNGPLNGPGRAVFVAGWGVVSGLGTPRSVFMDALFAGQRGILPRDRTALWVVPTTVAGELPASFWTGPELEGDPLPGRFGDCDPDVGGGHRRWDDRPDLREAGPDGHLPWLIRSLGALC